jgi:hypothetical protein
LYAKLTTIISNNGNNNINEFITVLYDEIIKINGLSGELLSLSKEDEVIIKSLKKDLLDFINQIVSKKNNQNEDQLMKGDQERLVRIILLAIINLSREYPEEREANILFISNLINKLTK